MRCSLERFVQERLGSEIVAIRKRDSLLAHLLDCPVQIARPEAMRLKPGSDLSPARGLERVLRRGWSFPEQWGIWSVAPKASIQVSFDPAIRFPAELELDLRAFTRPGFDQLVTISVNERHAAQLRFDPSRTECVHVIEIMAED